MREQRMVPGQKDLAERQTVAGRVEAGLHAKADEALRLVQSHPVRNPVTQAIDDDLGVVGEPIGDVAVQPAALKVEVVRRIPVVKRHPRIDSSYEGGVNQPVVKS